MSWSTSGLSVGLVPLGVFRPFSVCVFFADRSGAVLLLWDIFVVCVQCLSLVFCLVCSLRPCSRLLGADLLALLCVVVSGVLLLSHMLFRVRFGT